MRRLLLAAGALGVLVAPGARAGAPPAAVRLVYVAPAGRSPCPPAEVFQEEVHARLGQWAFSELASTLLVVVLEREGGGYHARMFVRHEDGKSSGERRILLTSCPETVRSLAVAAAVLLAPPVPVAGAGSGEGLVASASASAGREPPLDAAEVVAATPATEPPPQPPPQPQPPPSITVAAVAPRAPAPASLTARKRWQLGIAPVMQFTESLAGSRVQAGGAIGGALVSTRLALASELRVFVPTGEPVGRGQVSTGSIVANLLPCLRQRFVVGCAAAAGGVVLASASGFDQNRTIVRPYVALGARLGFEIGGGPLQVRPYMFVEAPITRWRFTVDGAGAFQQSPVFGGLGLDLLVHFR